MSLHGIQSRFLGSLLDAETPAARGMAVYHHAYRSRLIDALGETFERARLWIGDDAFAAAAGAHVARHRSASWTLDVYGHDFPATLSEFYPDDAEVCELAWLDGALRQAFAGPDAPAFDTAKLSAADWDTATLVPAPTLRLQVLTTNAAALWRALGQGAAPPEVSRLPAPCHVAVWKSDLEPRYRTLAPGEDDAVAGLAEGMRFADICAALERTHSEAATANLGVWLHQWLAEGLVCDVV